MLVPAWMEAELSFLWVCGAVLVQVTELQAALSVTSSGQSAGVCVCSLLDKK